ncbi:BLUF domain-containing protein [Zeaxanthinibacter sp. PT1]|uniref:BLUF domain-containing protein n=1 Tax=Zeaxanthinibacter TaxID=561554 RepID=UPI0023494D93|nr:BLUF domain-containing protein [Zeaxanthinibacter sp. PT1]MDC6351192.1 BLUF domain-containing protein [Zeaxanthinibacter sp. PT1]
MYSLVYKSVATPLFNFRDIDVLLERARAYNSNHGITGCLLYHNGEFIQYLEGPQLQVLNLYDKITKDPRHTKIQLLSYGATEHREFDQWDMAFENVYGENAQLYYVRLALQNFYLNPKPNYDTTIVSRQFWKNVGSLLNSSVA